MAFPSRHKTLYKSALSIHTERTDERFQTAHHRIVTADQEERVKWAHHEPSVSAGERVVATRHGQVYLHNVSIYLPPIVRLAWPTLLFAVNPEYDTAVHKDPTPWHVTTATFVPSPVHSGQQMSSNYTAVHYAATHVELIMEEHTHASLDVNNFVEQLESEVFESLPYSLAEHQTHMLGAVILANFVETAEMSSHSSALSLVNHLLPPFGLAETLQPVDLQLVPPKTHSMGLRDMAIVGETNFEETTLRARQISAADIAGTSYHIAQLPSAISVSETPVFESASPMNVTPGVEETSQPRRVSLPYKVLPESNKLFQDVLNKVIEDTKITEPFYMRHIFANDDTPDHVLIVPKSMVSTTEPSDELDQSTKLGQSTKLDQPTNLDDSFEMKAASPTCPPGYRKSVQVNPKQRFSISDNIRHMSEDISYLDKEYSRQLRRLTHAGVKANPEKENTKDLRRLTHAGDKMCLDREYARQLRRLTREFRKFSDLIGDDSDEDNLPRNERALSVLE